MPQDDEQPDEAQVLIPRDHDRHDHYRCWWIQVLLVAILAGFALFLQVTVWTLETYVQDERARLTQQQQFDTATKETTESPTTKTTKYSLPTDASTLYQRERQPPDTGASLQSAAKAYWNQAASILLRDWDAVLDFDNPGVLPLSSLWKERMQMDDALRANVTQSAILAMREAARLGHPSAQYVLANALVSGVWPLVDHHQPIHGSIVQDSWDPESQQDLTQAYLYWHLAAMAGHVESSMTLAYRLGGPNPAAAETAQSALRREEQCWKRLPYYQAAANGILDQLEADTNSRAKVVPYMDKHLLHHVHLHGGTGSKLDYNNKPDESDEALQYYHVKAVEGSGDGPSATSGYTLAKLYHYGLRGVTQNLTLAAKYYELAANHGHWEAAGQAGTLYLWGMGVEQDVYHAHKLFQMGIPSHRLEECQERFKAKIKQNKKEFDKRTVHLCEDACLNGMGLIRLLGLPIVAGVDEEEAEEWFELARDQGNIDAAYNLAMMKLGWKTHFMTLDQLPEDGRTQPDGLESVSGVKILSYPTQADYLLVLTELTTAASKGHLQAKHRLAMMYADGVKIPKGDSQAQVVPRDCDKALKNYKWIVENASPQRSRRLRTAYKQYVAGEVANSLRNYLYAAETGSDLARVNAAFLMERGECLGLGRIDCAKASVRLWKAAANRGSAEASLRVGDFYFYGRFREDSEVLVGPFGWVQYILYPELYLPSLWNSFRELVYVTLFGQPASEETSSTVASAGTEEKVCAVTDTEETCSVVDETASSSSSEHSIENDLRMAAQYYRMAAEKGANPRGNYNLGFLYEWGLGVTQDFPLAKRHYDLAVSSTSREADFPVAVALVTLRIHEFLVKLWMQWQGADASSRTPSTQPQSDKAIPQLAESLGAGRPVPSSPNNKTRMDVIMHHLLSWESFLILALTVILMMMLRLRRRTRR